MSVKTNLFKRGFKAVKDEEKRREESKKKSAGKLWRVFFPSDAKPDFELPVVFLTNEPINFHQHNVKEYGKFTTEVCTQDTMCRHCSAGDKPQYVGAFLVFDCRPFEREERDKGGNKTGKKFVVNESVKLLIRGMTDLAKLDRLENKYGLLGKEWSIARTGKDTSTTWNFDRGDAVTYTEAEVLNLLPDSLRDIVQSAESFEEGLFQIVESQIIPTEVEESVDIDTYASSQTKHHVRKVEEEDIEEEAEEEEEEVIVKPKSKLKSLKKLRGK